MKKECMAKIVPGDPAGGHVPWTAGGPIGTEYATGNCAGGRFGAGDYYSATSGNFQGMACTLGRIAGQTVASLPDMS